jgi:hypothetical protein
VSRVSKLNLADMKALLPPVPVIATESLEQLLARLPFWFTDHGVVASETLPMVRGHAESLIPLTARLADKDSQNTLTPADLTAPWRGPAPRKDALHAV